MQEKKTYFDKLRDVRKEAINIWKDVEETYLESIATVSIKDVENIDQGLWFEFKLPNDRIHHFSFEAYINGDDLFSMHGIELKKSIMQKVAQKALYQVGNFKIEESQNPTFIEQTHYGYRELEALHKDEDQFIKAAQAVVVASVNDDFSQYFNPSYEYFPVFTNDEKLLIKAILDMISTKFNFYIKLRFRSFKSTYLKGQYQIVELIFQMPMVNQKMRIIVFGHMLRVYEDKFAKEGLGTDQAIYFVLRELIKRNIYRVAEKNNMSETDKDKLLTIASQLPKYITDFKR